MAQTSPIRSTLAEIPGLSVEYKYLSPIIDNMLKAAVNMENVGGKDLITARIGNLSYCGSNPCSIYEAATKWVPLEDIEFDESVPREIRWQLIGGRPGTLSAYGFEPSMQ